MPLIYSMSDSLHGFIAVPDRDFSWTAPEAETFRFHIEQTRHLAAYVCGRRLCQEMLVWETAEQTLSGEADMEFAWIWRRIPKVVFSRTLNSVAGNARLATDDIATEVGRLRDQPGEGVVSIGGAALAGAAIAEDQIDEYRLFVYPVILGSGTPYFPKLAKPLDLQLAESRNFGLALGSSTCVTSACAEFGAPSGRPTGSNSRCPRGQLTKAAVSPMI